MTEHSSQLSTVEQIDNRASGTRLSGASYHPSEEKWDAQGYTGARGPSMISTVEQLIRVETLVGGKDGEGAQKKITTAQVDNIIEYMKRYEDENVWNVEPAENTTGTADVIGTDAMQVKNELASDSEDPWLTDRVRTIRSKEADLRENRHHWYDNIHADIVDKRANIARKMRQKTLLENFQVKIIHNKAKVYDDDPPQDEAAIEELTGVPAEDTEFTPDDCIHVDNCDGREPSEFGFTLPMPAIICHSGSGSRYPFVPWCGTVTCTCPTDNDPTATLCKHEIMALEYHHHEWPPENIELPPRYTRLFSPQAYQRWAKEV